MIKFHFTDIRFGQKDLVSHLSRSLEADPHVFLIDGEAGGRHWPQQLLGVVVDGDGAGQGVVDGSSEGVRHARRRDPAREKRLGGAGEGGCSPIKSQIGRRGGCQLDTVFLLHAWEQGVKADHA